MLICPNCKYEPKRKKNGDVRHGYVEFPWFHVHCSKECHEVWDAGDCFYVCPKCGVVFHAIHQQA